MKKKRGLKARLSNRLSYTLIAIFILVAIGIGVYALAPGVVPNPGHNINEVSIPSPCVAGQVLSYNGTNWKCMDLPQTVPSGAVMGWFQTTSYYGPGTNYVYGSVSFDAVAAGGAIVDPTGNVLGLPLEGSVCSTSKGVATSCTCPSDYSQAMGGQWAYIQYAYCNGWAKPCVVEYKYIFCIKN